MTRVPFVDLGAQYRSVKAEIDDAIASVIARSDYVGGAAIGRFEDAFAAYLGAKCCVGCANGTDAIELALEALGVGAGDEVLVPAHTWISTAGAIQRVGARPVFVDTDPVTFTIDPGEAERRCTSRTRALIPVHLYGHPCRIDALVDLARRKGLVLIEDCAQAHGATYRGRRVGTFGDAAAFSFYPAKNLGAFGDAGCVVTNHDETARRVRRLANHGQRTKADHAMAGRNSRLDTLQAAILLAKLPHLDGWIDLRRRHAARYGAVLADLHVAVPRELSECRHVYHLYVVQVPDRDRVRRELLALGVETGVHYPQALCSLSAFGDSQAALTTCPVAVDTAMRVLSLPIYAELPDDAIAIVAEALRTVLGRAAVPSGAVT